MNLDLLSWLQGQSDSMLDMLKRLVELESPTTDKAAIDRLGLVFAEELAASGAQVTHLSADRHGNHVRAVAGDASGDKQILVLGHLDTVWEMGTLQAMPFRVESGIAYGPGTFDMKAGLVQLVFALRALHETGRQTRRIVALINSDEETGSESSRPDIESEARRSRAALVLEPCLPDGSVKTFRKGVGVFELHVKGRPAHAGLDHEKGVSAIEEISRQVQLLHRMTDYQKGITINVGTIRGGTRSNVVAADAHAEIDLRVSTVADAEEIEKKILGLRPILKGAEIKVTGGIDRPPLERSPGVVDLYEKARTLAAEIGFDLREGSAGGSSDGNLTAALGVPTLDGLGPMGDGAHAESEHVVVSDLPRRTALLARLLETL
jgi:glutamate carboxypeptidase